MDAQVREANGRYAPYIDRRCHLCGGPIPLKIVVDGRKRNLQNRKYRLTCSPWHVHNTRRLEVPWGETVAKPKPSAEKRLEMFCRYQRRKRRERKKALIAMLGGQCASCGYNEDCPGAYDFHHRNPAEKSFQIAARGLLRRWDDLVAEIRKCALLYCRCHAEVHAGLHPEWKTD